MLTIIDVDIFTKA